MDPDWVDVFAIENGGYSYPPAMLVVPEGKLPLFFLPGILCDDPARMSWTLRTLDI